VTSLLKTVRYQLLEIRPAGKKDITYKNRFAVKYYYRRRQRNALIFRVTFVIVIMAMLAGILAYSIPRKMTFVQGTVLYIFGNASSEGNKIKFSVRLNSGGTVSVSSDGGLFRQRGEKIELVETTTWLFNMKKYSVKNR
jgi:hypothetical protein